MKLRPHVNVGDWQVMWWGTHLRFGWLGPWPDWWEQSMARKPVYDIRIGLGPIEVRRFAA